MAQFGRALRSGRRGRGFESRRLDSFLVIHIKANWSSGQDDALSRRKPGFDSRIGHCDLCMCSSSVERQLPKLERWVRFPSRALEDTPKISELLERAEILGDFCYTNMCA